MRVKLRTLMAGPNGVIQAGQVANLPSEEAEALIAGGYAEALDQPARPTSTPESPKVETESEPEQPARQRGRKRGR